MPGLDSGLSSTFYFCLLLCVVFPSCWLVSYSGLYFVYCCFICFVLYFVFHDFPLWFGCFIDNLSSQLMLIPWVSDFLPSCVSSVCVSLLDVSYLFILIVSPFVSFTRVFLFFASPISLVFLNPPSVVLFVVLYCWYSVLLLSCVFMFGFFY